MVEFFQSQVILTLLILFSGPQNSAGQSPAVSRDTLRIDHLPLKAIALADSAMDYRPGLVDLSNPDSLIQSRKIDGTLGYGFTDEGRITWVFHDNAITDGPGPDLLLLGQWPDSSFFHAWISQDNRHFIPLGRIPDSGQLDIDGKVESSRMYTYVRIRYTQPAGSREEARVHAIASLNGPMVLSIQAEQFFEPRTAIWHPDTLAVMQRLRKNIGSLVPDRLLIEAYCDLPGEMNYLQYITQKQADAVRQRLIREKRMTPSRIFAVGMGAASPVGDNETVEGQKKNRRLRFLIYPPSAQNTTREMLN